VIESRTGVARSGSTLELGGSRRNGYDVPQRYPRDDNCWYQECGQTDHCPHAQ